METETSSTPIFRQRRGIIMPNKEGIRMVLCVHCLTERPAEKPCDCDEAKAEREAFESAVQEK